MLLMIFKELEADIGCQFNNRHINWYGHELNSVLCSFYSSLFVDSILECCSEGNGFHSDLPMLV